VDIVTRLSALSREPGWDQRPCKGTPLELWYGPGDHTESPAEQRARQRWSKSLCAPCPILEDCRAEELARPASHQHGVRAGMSARQRRDEIRRLRAAARVADTGDAA
jgi:WhiB family transcriptional regulator, redox-sensing transcriptional regulator